ncbi:3-oxoacid CoA-transferase subunit A [Rhodoplanes sp. TEM]|uniref:3-oxoacid CoA-transferase subunit A n=1 Tax=Rhodoplanes tepidamans TaxID=200616 RepID=A0ABT5J3Y6_RHOTP|nr:MULTISPECIES: 3-oxoacid CoA-transferase subunit A [Rhodoplanes]MDC7784365.1 3-oxoacid CoA-transferase subunit A [Rhodoplanes tepidamans]MDC7983371.1 3-oxoacid CoA-transferase subunit A [Rhodoplanes sp. TEM]MDQ0354506.1 acetate CoA/acetoacetate CoA-transferase alpha subunit [Rhodoplanes tepidamans]
MSSKLRTKDEIVALFADGQTIVVGGFANHGVPDALIDCVLDSGARHLTLLSNDTGDADLTIGRLVHAGRVDKVVASHIGMNTETVALVASGKIEVTLVPQGSLAERMRCGGAGLGGVLTKTGLGTVAEKGKTIVEVDGERWLLEPALRGDVGLVRARSADPIGNLTYRGTCRNFNPLVARAAAVTVVEADMLVELDEIEGDSVVTPGVYVDMILAK